LKLFNVAVQTGDRLCEAHILFTHSELCLNFLLKGFFQRVVMPLP
jgi:hypothetical protein